MGKQRVIERAGIVLSVVVAVVATWMMLHPGQGDALPRYPHIDKLAHFLAFFIIALPALIARPKSWLWIVLAVSALGGMIEIIQPWFGREREFADFVADALGALAAVPVARWLSERWQLHQRNGPKRQD